MPNRDDCRIDSESIVRLRRRCPACGSHERNALLIIHHVQCLRSNVTLVPLGRVLAVNLKPAEISPFVLACAVLPFGNLRTR